ncbi:MAG: c-type cytochrome [Sulfurimonadaceae bacterium]|jgi:ubiquinol-cytochrome c reductase cytochrome c1 subunit|nr:c-type cytochrome [Sulfurimonadaceae bacterium]
MFFTEDLSALNSIAIGLIVAIVLFVINFVLAKAAPALKEIRILIIVSVMAGYVYWGFEPFAHHEMHPPVADVSYTFDGKGDIEQLEAKIEQTKKQVAKLQAKGKDTSAIEALIESMHEQVEATKAFWQRVGEVSSLHGNVQNGKTLVAANCLACHSMEYEGYPALMSDADSAATYGVVPPDLSLSGRIYDANFLAGLIIDPVKAMHIEHKYPANGEAMFPMPASDWMENQEVRDIVAYLVELGKGIKAPETAEDATPFEVSKAHNKQVFEAACVRCHDMSYAGIKAHTPADTMKDYIGATPPDLSQYIKSRGNEFLHNFINDPQRQLEGTGMPRVGLTQEAEKQVVEYMTQIGDSKKEEREALGPIVILYVAFLAIFAFLWKKQIWRKLH